MQVSRERANRLDQSRTSGCRMARGIGFLVVNQPHLTEHRANCQHSLAKADGDWAAGTDSICLFVLSRPQRIEGFRAV